MFDDNHIEKSLKSILENGQEDVPARIWDGISEGLDRIERRKRVVLWVRRTGVIAAAAAIALGVFLNIGQDQTIIPDATDSQMIAVTEPETATHEVEESAVATTPFKNLTAYVKPEVKEKPVITQITETEHIIEPSPTPEPEPVSEPVSIAKSKPAVSTEDTNPTEAYVDNGVWAEDDTEVKERRIKTSIVISGIAGTNNPQSKEGLSPMKSPTLGKQYTKTTIEQTSTETLYGIPLSFGVGVRLHFSERWSLGMGLNYSLLTSKFNGKYIQVTDGVEEAPVAGNVRNVQHYIGIPINAYYDIFSKDFIKLYAYAGGTVEKCVQNRYQVQATTVINHSENVNGVQLSANAGIGVEFVLGRHVGLYIDPSLRYYFNNGQPKSIRSSQPLMLGFEAGLRFNL